ncbi:MAG: HVO_0649 family zinc finger protein [Halobacteriaceae archaeon]
MSLDHRSGTTPLDRLRAHLDEDLQCPACGYEDEVNGWTARTSGSRIRYAHVCSRCGYVHERTIRLRRS